MLIFGYGSLINIKSLQATVPGATEVKPAYIKGHRREYSKLDPIGWRSHHTELSGIAYCALDVVPHTDTDSIVNGVIFNVDELELEALIKREEGYKIIRTPAYDFFQHELLGDCLLFSSGLQDGIFEHDNTAQTTYHTICLDGCNAIDQSFYDMFMSTTHIGPNSTQTLKDIF